MKIFKQKRLRRVLSLVFAFTLVFTLAMSTGAVVNDVEGKKTAMTSLNNPEVNYNGTGSLQIFVPSFIVPYEIVRAETDLVAFQTDPEDTDSEGETFELRIQLHSFDDYTWVYEGAYQETGVPFNDSIDYTFHLSPSEVIVAVRAEYYLENELQEYNNCHWLPSITLYGTEATTPAT